MNTEQFLDRVLPPGNFIAIAWKSPAQDGLMIHRFFARSDVAGAASMLKWASGKGNDTWFATAAFEAAIQSGTDKRGNPKYKGERKQENVSLLKAFWIDADVRRQGDKKGSNVYETREDAARWLAGFLPTVGLPMPNMRVNSGYGFHWYWILEDPMTRADWQPYADALAAAMKQHGFKCETGITVDSARLLRPPELLNFKAGAPGVPTTAKSNQGDYPNALILGALQPYVGLLTTTVVQAPASGLAGGAPAAALTGIGSNLNAAAQAGIIQAPAQKRSFAEIATKCEQIKLSLATGGNGEAYQHWYLGNLSLAHHCADGAQFAHEISKGDPRYTQQGVDAAMARIAAEKAVKDTGPPRCTAFDGYRPGVCQLCPHFGKITGPWVLGVANPNGDLPPNYRRNNGTIEKMVNGPAGLQYITISPGDVYGPIVDHGSDGYSIQFTYEQAGRKFPVRFSNEQLAGDAGTVGANLARQSVTIEVSKFPLFREFLVSWISTIRDQKGERMEQVPAFGFATDKAGDHIGVAIGGTLYRSDGSTEAAPGPSQAIIDAYTPHGDYAKWRQTFDIVTNGAGGIERQIIIAGAFGSPLMQFTGQKGLVISVWGPSSMGKSAAMRVGQSVYSKPSMMSTLKSTDNAANHKAHTTQFLPSYWDEMRTEKDEASKLINRIFDMAQGQGAQRLTSTIQLREPETWQTLAIVASNQRLMDFVVDKVKGNDAGAVRLFEFEINIPKLKNTASVAPIVQQVEKHYGHAGRMFLSWIATHYAETKKLVEDITNVLVKDLAQEAEERMYIAGIAAMLAGAKIANKQGIAKFDVKGMYEFFKHWFFRLRHDRGMNLVTVGGKTDVEEVLSQFVSTHTNSRVITDKMSGLLPGRPAAVKVEWPPQTGRAEIQIAEQDQLMRINYSTFTTWCRQRHLNGLDVEDQIKARFNATRGKMTIAAGTPYATGRMNVLEIVLTHPALAGYLTSSQQVRAAQLAAAPVPQPVV